MKNIREFINESLIFEAIQINSVTDTEFNNFLEYILKYSKSLKIQSAERNRYEKKGIPLTKEIAQELLSKRLYNNVSVRYASTPEFFLEICQKNNITVNMSNLGFGKDAVIKWVIPEQIKNEKIKAKDVYFDNTELVWIDKTIGFRNVDYKNRKIIDDGIKLLSKYKDKADEILDVLNKKFGGFPAHKWYIIEN